MNEVEVQWKHGPDFAEIAEALGINTSDIMAAMPKEDGILALYTTETEKLERATTWFAQLHRGDNGILVADEAQPANIDLQALFAGVEEAVKKRLDSDNG